LALMGLVVGDLAWVSGGRSLVATLRWSAEPDVEAA
jgi:hypothetical protein